MSIKQNIKFNITDEMLNDSKDFLDSVEVTTIALECKKLKQKEDEVAALEEQLKNKVSLKTIKHNSGIFKNLAF